MWQYLSSFCPSSQTVRLNSAAQRVWLNSTRQPTLWFQSAGVVTWLTGVAQLTVCGRGGDTSQYLGWLDTCLRPPLNSVLVYLNNSNILLLLVVTLSNSSCEDKTIRTCLFPGRTTPGKGLCVIPAIPNLFPCSIWHPTVLVFVPFTLTHTPVSGKKERKKDPKLFYLEQSSKERQIRCHRNSTLLCRSPGGKLQHTENTMAHSWISLCVHAMAGWLNSALCDIA